MSPRLNWTGTPADAAPPAAVRAPAWRDELPRLLAARGDHGVLAHGAGRSYGDVCLNPDGVLVETRGLDRVLTFDAAAGVIEAESGVTFRQLLEFLLPRGWFVPVTPGTAHATLGGAVANDVHGKDHPASGTFGSHVVELELVRSDHSAPLVSRPAGEHAETFAATVGGLGLTGFVTRVMFRPQRVPGPWVEVRNRRGDAIAALAEPGDPAWPHRVAWLDFSATDSALGAGIVSEGRFAAHPGGRAAPRWGGGLPTPPLPAGVLGPWSFRLLNHLRRVLPVRAHGWQSAAEFFYPLDRLDRWDRAYGGRGFYQHQSVVPGPEGVRELLRAARKHGEASFVTVLKALGSRSSPGMLSFPREGLTLAMDFANRGERTLRMLDALDAVVLAHGGRVYPAKDARMSAETFKAGFPRWQEFARHIDPAFSSGFWRRVGL